MKNKTIILDKIRNLCIFYPEKFPCHEDELFLTIRGYGKINKTQRGLERINLTSLENIHWKMEKLLLKIKA